MAAAAAATLIAACSPGQEKPKASAVIFTYVTYPILDESIVGIREGLAEQGYGPDKLQLREVNANGQSNLVASYAQEVIASKPTVLIPVSTPVTQAVVASAPPSQAVVFSTVTNPADVGMDKRPPNITGVSDVVNYEANVDLIRELFPQARRIAMLYNPAEANSQFALAQLKPLLAARQLSLVLVPVNSSDEVAAAVRTLSGRADVIYVGSDNTVASAIEGVVATARRAKLPVIASDVGSVEKGALAAVSVDYRALGREAGRLAAKVMSTGKPAGDFPNVLFRGDRLVLNQEAARATGFAFPQGLLSRAKHVIPAKRPAA